MLQKRIMVSFWLITLALSAFAQSTDEPSPAVQVINLTIYEASLQRGAVRGLHRIPTRAEAQIENQENSHRVNVVEVQIDIMDNLRRVPVDRLFLKLEDIGFGDRSIKPGKRGKFSADMGNYRLPDGCAQYGSAYAGTLCVSKAKINRIEFKDGTIWERKGWRDEPRIAK